MMILEKMMKFPGRVCFHQLAKHESLLSARFFRSCLQLQGHTPEGPCAAKGMSTFRLVSWLLFLDCQQLSFHDITLVSFFFFQLKTMQMF